MKHFEIFNFFSQIISKLSEVGLICSNIAICYKELKFYRKSIAYSKLVPIFNVSANIKQQNEFRNLQCQFISGRISSLNVGTWNEIEKRLTKLEMTSLKILESQSVKGGYDWDKIVKKYLDPKESKKQLFEVADFCGKSFLFFPDFFCMLRTIMAAVKSSDSEIT